MRFAIGLVVVIVVGGASACLQSNSVLCPWGKLCPAGLACDTTHELCVAPDQLASCSGAPDAQACAIGASATPGICRDEVCLPPACGDHLVTGHEVCDGAPPAAGTCIDFAYDYGDLACNATQCTQDPSTCHLLGWHPRATAASDQSAVEALAIDGSTVWLAYQRGLEVRTADGWLDLGDPLGVVLDKRALWAGDGTNTAVYAGPIRGQFDTSEVLVFDGAAPRAPLPTAPLTVRGIWQRAGDDLYAVGTIGPNGAIAHYAHGAWTVMTLPANTLAVRAIWGTANVAFAVGDSGALRLVGETWVPAGGNPAMTGVWGASDAEVWAVGTTQYVLVGDQFEIDPRRHHDLTGATRFGAIAGRSAHEIYAAGVIRLADGTATDVAVDYFDGQRWAPMDAELALGPSTALAVGPDEVVFGRNLDTVFASPRAAWTFDETSPGDTVHGMWAVGDAYQIAVGDAIEERSVDGAGSVQWQTADPCPAHLYLDAWASTADRFATSAYGSVAHAAAGGSWQCETVDAGQARWVWDVWGPGASAPGQAFVVGASGANSVPLFARRDGAGAWSGIALPAGIATLNGLWGSSASDVWLVGTASDGGAALVHYDGGGAPSTIALPAGTPALWKVWGSGAHDVFAVGAAGAILHYDGAGWSAMHVPRGEVTATHGSIRDVFGTGPNDVYAIEDLALLHYDGTGWAPVARTDTRVAETGFALPDATILVAGATWKRLVGVPLLP